MAEKLSSVVTVGKYYPMGIALNHNVPMETFPINATNCYFLCFVPFQGQSEVMKCSRCHHVLKGTDFRNQIDEVFLDLVW